MDEEEMKEDYMKILEEKKKELQTSHHEFMFFNAERLKNFCIKWIELQEIKDKLESLKEEDE